MRSRTIRWAGLLPVILGVGIGCGSDSSSGPDPDPGPTTVLAVAARFAIDGVIDLDAMDGVDTRTVEVRSELGAGDVVRESAVRWAIVNDDRHLYLAISWTDPTWDHTFDAVTGPVDYDGLQLVFDEDADGIHDTGDDARALIAARVGSQYVDLHRTDDGSDETDLVGDGFGKLVYHADDGRYDAELLLPLADDATGEDGPLLGTARWNLLLIDHLQTGPGTGNLGHLFPGFPASTGWPTLDLADVVAEDHPGIPEGLGGRIVFLSDRDGPNGEIYTFDPATGEVRRVTTLPDLWKDAISLSHDRTRIAFHGAASAADVEAYEIYTVNIDGTRLRQLTDNTITDGHPAWSPGDDRIAHASFRSAAGASIVLIDTLGNELLDLTQGNADDNDPDFLPDGRIVFKTDRFSTLPEVRIAVMNDDGTGVVQLTDVGGVSDHDPTSDGTDVVFERFTKDTDFALDPDAGFVPWDLIRVPAGGGPEELLFSDGWINWLPIHGPASMHLAYLKGSGSTAIHLLTREGEDLGRLVPGYTRVRYLDWK